MGGERTFVHLPDPSGNPRRVSHGPKPCKFIGFGDIHGPKPYKFIGFGDIHGPKPYKIIGFHKGSGR